MAAIYIGSDGYSHIHDIPKITARTLTGDADMVIGSHYMESGKTLPFNQKIKTLIHKIPKKSDVDSAFTDPFSNIRSFSRKALGELDFKTDGFNIEIDIILHLLSIGLVIEEVPLTKLALVQSDSKWGYPVKILAAMPAFNEEKFIAKTIVGAKKYVDQVIVVDDGSNDATKDIAEEMGVMVIRHEKNSGYGASLQTIFDKARELHIEALVILDADGQHNPEDVGRLLEALVTNDVDVVIGSRFLRDDDKKIPGYRKVGMKVLDNATRIAGVAEISDSQSGFRVYGKRAIDVINLTGDGMSAGSEILIQISDNKLRIAEVPIHVRYDIEDTSSENPVKHGMMVLYNIIGLISYRRPLQAFGIPGAILIIFGMIAEIWTFTDLYTTHNQFHYVLAIGSAFCIIFGMLVLSVGLILNYLITFVRVNSRK
jgi:glycosyltransferase involved in cell wall biosynthesis